MIKIFIKFFSLAMAAGLVLSCSKETNDNIDEIEKFYRYNPEAIAQVKFIHAYTPLTINGTGAAVTSGTTTTGTGFRITMDGNKLNGALNNHANTNTLIWGGVFPATSAYAFLPPGAHTFKFIMNRISTSGTYTPIAGDEVFSATVNLTGGKRYSMFIADPYGPPSPFMVEDNFEEPPRNFYGLRFINLTAEAAARYDVFSARNGTKLFSNIGYKEITSFMSLATTATDTLYLRTAGTNTVLGQINGFTPGSQRVYTLYARGKTGVTGRTPSISIYTNR